MEGYVNQKTLEVVELIAKVKQDGEKALTEAAKTNASKLIDARETLVYKLPHGIFLGHDNVQTFSIFDMATAQMKVNVALSACQERIFDLQTALIARSEQLRAAEQKIRYLEDRVTNASATRIIDLELVTGATDRELCQAKIKLATAEDAIKALKHTVCEITRILGILPPPPVVMNY
jgi:hypothetical protein